MLGKVLVVDDLERARRALASELTDAGFEVIEAEDGTDAWEQFRLHRPDAVVTDMVMPNSDGIDLLGRIRSQSDVPVILFTARGSIQTAAIAFKGGADDFVASDEVEIDDLVQAVSRAIAERAVPQPGDGLADRIAGKSPAIQRLRERVAGLAPLRHPVLVCGEQGSGRDLAVDALHELGSSGQGTLVRVPADQADARMTIPDCSAIYLDGIEAFPKHAQSFWTRYVEDCEKRGFQGSPRILASSANPTATLANTGQIDQLLRDRMLRYAIELPPLRAIPDDIPAIADSLVERGCERVGRRVRLSPAAREFLAQQRWPGNAAQLEQLLERSIAFTRGRQVRRETVQDVLAELEESLDSIREHHAVLEREALMRAIRDTGGNITRTAETLGKSRGAVYRLIQKHNIPLRRRH
jgi:DNA-binding NtrC family response regulator